MTTLPVWVHEAVVAPLALGLSFRHARRALGAARALVEILCLVAYGYALEAVVMRVFGSHAYSGAFRVAPFGVPLAVAAVWGAVITSGMALAARLGLESALGRAAGAALLGMALDSLMEPVAARAGLWLWTPPGSWLGVPVGNFVGWAVIVGSYTLGAEGHPEDRGLFAQAPRRLLLAAASILGLVGVGLVWRTLGAEERCGAGTGWAIWGAILVAAAAIGARRGRSPRGGGLAGRLGAAPGRGPEAVFLVLGAAFAIDALVLGGAVAAVAAGVGATLLWTAARARP